MKYLMTFGKVFREIDFCDLAVAAVNLKLHYYCFGMNFVQCDHKSDEKICKQKLNCFRYIRISRSLESVKRF